MGNKYYCRAKISNGFPVKESIISEQPVSDREYYCKDCFKEFANLMETFTEPHNAGCKCAVIAEADVDRGRR
jgi:hypothetical protein